MEDQCCIDDKNLPVDEVVIDPPESSQTVNRKRRLAIVDIQNRLKKTKRQKTFETLDSRVTPLIRYSYEDQLELKLEYITTCIRRLRKNFNSEAWDAKNIRAPSMIIESVPKARLGYRNKCEFTVGGSGPEKCVVGLIKDFVNDEPVVVSPNGCAHVSAAMKEVVFALEGVMKESGFPAYSRRERKGLWRLVLIRQSSPLPGKLGSLMVVVQVSELPAASKAELTTLFVEALVEGKSKAPINMNWRFSVLHGCVLFDGSWKVDSLFLQQNTAVPDGMAANGCILVYGHDHIEQSIMGLKFRISPTSFFQVNNITCETLYEKAIEFLDPSPGSLVLDICSGTGTIALCLAAKRGGPVVGIEMDAEATQRAEESAELNGMTGMVSFIAGKAEDVLERILADNVSDVKMSDSNEKNYSLQVKDAKAIYAIIDPPRAGLHRKAKEAILSCKRIKRLVYVSCNGDSFVQDAISLCGGSGFFLKNAIGIDMFPNTIHTEIVALFER